MKKSIKMYILVFSLIMVVITYIATIIALYGFEDLSKILNLNSLIVLAVLIIVTVIGALFVSKSITFPLRKIEKNMNIVASGKIPNTKQLKDYTKVSEMQDIISSYRAMIEVIKKNNLI